MHQNKPKKKYTYPPVSSSSNPPTIYKTSRSPTGLLSEAQCSLVVDCGVSFTHASPVFQNLTLNYAVKRIDLGGKALTNYLKELISFRSVNVMYETFIIDHVKENLCFVSLDLPTHLNIATKTGNHNLFRSTYVLPDGVTHTKGFVKYPPHHHCSPSSIRPAIRETVTAFLTQLPTHHQYHRFHQFHIVTLAAHQHRLLFIFNTNITHHNNNSLHTNLISKPQSVYSLFHIHCQQHRKSSFGYPRALVSCLYNRVVSNNQPRIAFDFSKLRYYSLLFTLVSIDVIYVKMKDIVI